MCSTEEPADTSESATTPSPSEEKESESSEAAGNKFFLNNEDQPVRWSVPNQPTGWGESKLSLSHYFILLFVQVSLHSKYPPPFSWFLLTTTNAGAADTHTHTTPPTTTRSCCSMPSTRACSSPTATARRSVFACLRIRACVHTRVRV